MCVNQEIWHQNRTGYVFTVKIVLGAENDVKIINGDKTDVKFLDYILTCKFVRGAKYCQSHKRSYSVKIIKADEFDVKTVKWRLIISKCDGKIS